MQPVNAISMTVAGMTDPPGGPGLRGKDGTRGDQEGDRHCVPTVSLDKTSAYLPLEDDDGAL